MPACTKAVETAGQQKQEELRAQLSLIIVNCVIHSYSIIFVLIQGFEAESSVYR